MQCPSCKNVALVMADRQGVEIDYCPQCRGVWLDRGELDKIIERSVSPTTKSRNRDDDDEDDDDYGPRQPKRKKKGGFLSDLFDFG